ncbi:MAG: hypothetical protein L6R37_002885 [Teloschistes peruensis]|nr:MAG: hypothetical protein L6R37_002885 [Teloschistes peruensis]
MRPSPRTLIQQINHLPSSPLPLLILLLLLLTLSPTPAHTVSVTIGGKRWLFTDVHGNTQLWTFGCHNLAPGECCLKPPGLLLDPGFVTFTGLQDLDIAFLWKMQLLSEEGAWPVEAREGCEGESFRSVVGGAEGQERGRWEYKWNGRRSNSDPSGDTEDGQPNPRVAGANYLRLPPKLPPSSAEVNWLGMEGLGGFVWDKGRWLCPDQLLSAFTTGFGSGLRRRGGKGKGTGETGQQISKNRSVWRGGRFVARRMGRERGRWPDWVGVGGKNYSNIVEGEGGVRYRDAEGKVLVFNGTVVE